MLEQHRLYFSTPNTRPGEARDAHGWAPLRDSGGPHPDDGRSPLEKCEALAESEPRVRQWFESNTWRYEDGCVGWAGFQQNLSAVFNAPACPAAVGLGILYFGGCIRE